MSYQPPQGPPPPPPPPGQQPPAQQPAYGGPPPEQKNATTILLLGIFGLLCCGPLSIVAVVMGSSARDEIAASNGAIGGESKVQAGWILGWVGIALWVIGTIGYFGLGLGK